MSIGTFTILKNESEFIGYHIMALLAYVDEMVFADGNSNDGTIEIIRYIKKTYDKQNKIKLFINKDCKDLTVDYQKLFNWTLKQVKSEYTWFIHPDMICINPETIKESLEPGIIRYNVKMISFAGDREHIFTEGRSNEWATIYANKLGLHFWGNYGDRHEDFYFKDITNNEHIYHKYIGFLPYKIKNTNIQLYHYCDTKPYERRLNRMVSVLRNIMPLYKETRENDYLEFASAHPRVTIQDGYGMGVKFKIDKVDIPQPEVFKQHEKEFERFRKTN